MPDKEDQLYIRSMENYIERVRIQLNSTQDDICHLKNTLDLLEKQKSTDQERLDLALSTFAKWKKQNGMTDAS